VKGVSHLACGSGKDQQAISRRDLLNREAVLLEPIGDASQIVRRGSKSCCILSWREPSAEERGLRILLALDEGVERGLLAGRWLQQKKQPVKRGFRRNRSVVKLRLRHPRNITGQGYDLPIVDGGENSIGRGLRQREGRAHGDGGRTCEK
jgi:hypothetical protein